MPRPGPRRPNTAVRLTEEEAAALDDRAREEGLLMRSGRPNRSEMIRHMLAYAAAEMPQGWRPK